MSVVEGGRCDFLVTHCQLKLVEYINRKKHRHGGPDERVRESARHSYLFISFVSLSLCVCVGQVHVCVYVLDPTQDRIPGQQATLMQKLSTVVNLVPVIGKVSENDSCILTPRRVCVCAV